MKEKNPKLLTGLVIDFLESQGAKRAVEDLAALCQEAYGQRQKAVPISKLLELARHHQLAADDCLRVVLTFLEVEYGGPVVLDGNTDTVLFKERGAEGIAARVEVTGRILSD